MPLLPDELVTPRLRLRPLSFADAPALAALTDDETVTRNLLKTKRPFTLQHAQELIARVRDSGFPVWAIDDGALVGVIGLQGEFGFWLAHSARGRGYGFESGRAVMAHAFDVLGCAQLIARPIADNTRSRRLLSKLGFQVIGHERAWCAGRGDEVALVIMTAGKPAFAPDHTFG